MDLQSVSRASRVHHWAGQSSWVTKWKRRCTWVVDKLLPTTPIRTCLTCSTSSKSQSWTSRSRCSRSTLSRPVWKEWSRIGEGIPRGSCSRTTAWWWRKLKVDQSSDRKPGCRTTLRRTRRRSWTISSSASHLPRSRSKKNGLVTRLVSRVIERVRHLKRHLTRWNDLTR